MPTIAEKLASKAPLKVLITGACGQIAYNLIFLVARGDMLGPSQPVTLHLLDIPALGDKLEAIVMELHDCASPLLAGIVATTDVPTAFTDVDIALLVGARPRGPGMERRDLLTANAGIFKSQGQALDAHASRDVRVLVVGNPANTNALIAASHAPSIPRSHFTALTRLDLNRAKAAVAGRVGVHVSEVKDVVIWGNHSTTQYPDTRYARVGGAAYSPTPVDAAWLKSDFIGMIQTRGKAVIDKRGASSAASAASAIVDHVHDWMLGSGGEMVSMGVHTGEGGAYGVAPGLVFSMPCLCTGAGEYTVVTHLEVDDFSRDKFKVTEEELLMEREMALGIPAAPAAAAV